MGLGSYLNSRSEFMGTGRSNWKDMPINTELEGFTMIRGKLCCGISREIRVGLRVFLEVAVLRTGSGEGATCRDPSLLTSKISRRNLRFYSAPARLVSPRCSNRASLSRF